MTLSLRSIAPLAVAGLLAAAGCGSDDDGGGGDRLSASEYREQATQICTESDKRTQALDEPQKAEDLKPYLEQGVDITEEDLDKFAELNPPEDLQDKHDAAVEASDEAVAKLREVIGELEGNEGDAEKIQNVEPEVQEATEAFEKSFRDLGLDECADDS